MYKPPNSNIRQRIVTDRNERQNILWQMHSAPHAGQSGVNATVDKITQLIYWKGVKNDVQAYVSYLL